MILFVGLILYTEAAGVPYITKMSSFFNNNIAPIINNLIDESIFNGHIKFDVDACNLMYYGQFPIELQYLNDYQSQLFSGNASQFSNDFINCFNSYFIAPFAHAATFCID